MKVLDAFLGTFRPRRLTRWRMALAVIVALTADGLQAGVLGAPPFAEIVDVVAMVLESWLIGFHILLLPTFLLELVPVVDALPTWTACTVTVIILRKRNERATPLPARPESNQLPKC